MAYKTELQNNNIDLQTILDTINKLPDPSTGGGSSNVVVEALTASTCVFTNTDSSNCKIVITTSQNIGEIVGLNAYTQWLEVVTYPYVQSGDTLDEADYVINDCNNLHYIND